MMKIKRKLSETVQVLVVTEPNQGIMFENMMAEWRGMPYAQLSVVLVYLKFLSALHENHHLTCKGDPFYGDHLLFSRLYDAVQDEVDTVAEKAIGLGCTSNVDLHTVYSQVLKLIDGAGSGATIPQSSDLARKSLVAELNFLKVIDECIESLEECGMLTNGVDNLLQGSADKHEGHVYLLKQRCSSAMM